MRFTGLRVLSDTQVEMYFEGDDGTPVTHVFSSESVTVGESTLRVVNGDHEYGMSYRCYTVGPAWPENLAAAAWQAAREPLIAGTALARQIEENKAARKAWWKSIRGDVG
ncbi:MAG: hypothetical protein HOV71_15855 [Hamadaea sp.]|nr:hypothetical protein [Hamadaea sp.]NUR49605.1 hypothetical protein [Hamadaea sp.]NUT06800.1 hypothetical protein [Hamadaea sp.]